MADLSNRGFKSNNAGVALITVLVIVAVVSAITADVAMNQQLWLSQAQNQKDRAQAEWVNRGAQQYAAMMMDRDKRDNQVDDLDEAWAKPIPPLQAEGGAVTVSIEDLEGRFNLNSLYQGGKYNADYGAVFRRLLAEKGINENLLDALLDWMDKDSNTRPGGAEDDYYQNLTPGYRAANQAMLSARELLLIKGFTPESAGKLDALVVALPQPTPININTAPPEVLAALFEGMPIEEAKHIVEYREKQPFQQVAELKKAIQGTYPMPKESLLTTTSEYFLVRSAVKFGHYYQHSLAFLHRPQSAGTAYYYYHDRPLIRIEEEKSGDG